MKNLILSIGFLICVNQCSKEPSIELEVNLKSGGNPSVFSDEEFAVETLKVKNISDFDLINIKLYLDNNNETFYTIPKLSSDCSIKIYRMWYKPRITGADYIDFKFSCSQFWCYIMKCAKHKHAIRRYLEIYAPELIGKYARFDFENKYITGITLINGTRDVYKYVRLFRHGRERPIRTIKTLKANSIINLDLSNLYLSKARDTINVTWFESEDTTWDWTKKKDLIVLNDFAGTIYGWR